MSRDQRKWFNAVRANLTPDLLKPGVRRRLKATAPRVAGHCYVATEALYHAFGKSAGFKRYVAGTADGGTHWWLYNPSTDSVIDQIGRAHV